MAWLGQGGATELAGGTGGRESHGSCSCTHTAVSVFILGCLCSRRYRALGVWQCGCLYIVTQGTAVAEAEA